MALNKLKNIDLQNITPKLMVLGLIIAAFVIGMLWQKVQYLEKGGTTSTTTATTPTQPPAAKVELATIKGLWDKDLVKFGDATKKVLFVEIGDPSCPYCHVAAGKDPELNKQMGANFILSTDGGSYVAPVTEMRKLVDSGKASFAYVYYPGHGAGEMGMKALYCANEKGKFWDAHDLLMSNAGYNLMNTTVKNDKSQSGVVANFLKGAVDANFMKTCLDSGKYDKRLGDDIAVAGSLGVQGTPGFFVNDTAYPGAYSWNDMKTSADNALK